MAVFLYEEVCNHFPSIENRGVKDIKQYVYNIRQEYLRKTTRVSKK